jgi:cytochrome c peroxidase
MNRSTGWIGVARLACAGAAIWLVSGVATAAAPAPTLSPVEALGKALFFDKISTPARSMSCASCHAPRAGWVGAIAGSNLHGAVYRGAERTRFGDRKPPSSSYASLSPVFHFDAATGEFVGGNFWDGRATGERLGSPTAEQALGPHLNPVEQNMPDKQAVCEHVRQSQYATLFAQVYGPASLDCSVAGVDLTYDRFGLAMAAYQGSVEVSPFSSRFDAYWRSCMDAVGDAEACGTTELNDLTLEQAKPLLDPRGILTDQEFAGLLEFSEYCSSCHVSDAPGPGGVPPLFTNHRFSNVGVPKNPENPFYGMDEVYLDDGTPINPLGAAWVDRGLGNFLRTRPEWASLAEAQDGKFRVPTVRNVDLRPGAGFPKAYMHNGALKSLEEVVHFYNTRDVASAGWAPPEVSANVNRDLFEGKPMGGFELTAEAEASIVAFLRTLSDGYAIESRVELPLPHFAVFGMIE